MAESVPPPVECEQVHPGLAVSDIATALESCTKKLGFTTAFTWGDPPTFANVNLGKVQMFLRKGTPDPKGCVVSFLVGDAEHGKKRTQLVPP